MEKQQRSKVRWGIVGCARIAEQAIIPAIRNSEKATIVGIASRDAGKAAKFAKRCGIARSYGSYSDLLQDSDIEAVYIPLPNHLHAEWTIKAAEYGKHILCEKPLAMNEEEARRMVEASKANNVYLMEAFMYRFHPLQKRVLALIKDGAIGKPKLVRAAFSFIQTEVEDYRRRVEMGGGSLMDVGCYCVNVGRLLLGGEPQQVYALAEYSTPNGIDLSVRGVLSFENDIACLFDCSFMLPFRDSYEVVGTEGFIAVPRAFLPGPDESSKLFIYSGEESLELRKSEEIAAADHYLLEVDHFSECITRGQEPEWSAEDGVRNMRVLDAVRRSMMSGKVESVVPPPKSNGG